MNIVKDALLIIKILIKIKILNELFDQRLEIYYELPYKSTI